MCLRLLTQCLPSELREAVPVGRHWPPLALPALAEAAGKEMISNIARSAAGRAPQVCVSFTVWRCSATTRYGRNTDAKSFQATKKSGFRMLPGSEAAQVVRECGRVSGSMASAVTDPAPILPDAAEPPRGVRQRSHAGPTRRRRSPRLRQHRAADGLPSDEQLPHGRRRVAARNGRHERNPVACRFWECDANGLRAWLRHVACTRLADSGQEAISPGRRAVGESRAGASSEGRRQWKEPNSTSSSLAVGTTL